MKGYFLKATLALLIVFLTSSFARADEVTFRANAPVIVSQEESFRVEFSLNAEPDADTFSAPDFANFDVLAGPATSQGHSIQIINGEMTKSVNYTITYVLLPQGTGNFTIGSASIGVGGKTYTTRNVAIEVNDQPSERTPERRRHKQGNRPQVRIFKLRHRDVFRRTTCCCVSTFPNNPPIKESLCWLLSSYTEGFPSLGMRTSNSLLSTDSGRRTSTFPAHSGSVKP